MSKEGSRSWLRDIIISRDKVFVLSDLSTNYILTPELEYVSEFILEPGVKYFYYATDEKVVVCIANQFLELDHNGIVTKEYTGEYVDILKQSRGREYLLENNTIKNKFGTVYFPSPFHYVWEQYYDGINIDFDKNKVVYFQIVEGNYLLNILRYKNAH